MSSAFLAEESSRVFSFLRALTTSQRLAEQWLRAGCPHRRRTPRSEPRTQRDMTARLPLCPPPVPPSPPGGGRCLPPRAAGPVLPGQSKFEWVNTR